MDAARILVLGPGAGLPSLALLSKDASVVAEAATTVQEAIRKLSESGFAAVVCWAERQDELAAIIRIKKSTSGVPILLVTPQNDDAFEALARQLGASLVVHPESTSAKTATTIALAIATGRLAAAARSHAQAVHQQAQELRQMVRKTKELSLLAQSRLRPAPRLLFVPLVVEAEASAAFHMVRAMEKASVFAPLPVLRGRDEAIRYLDELSRPGARAHRTLPSILLIDSELPEDGAITILKHVRGIAAFAGLPVILMGPPGQNAKMNRAYEAGANSVLERPAGFDELVLRIGSLKDYWGSVNHGPGAF